MQDGGACSLEAISLKSRVALWDNWMCGRLPGEPKLSSSIFTFNDSDDSQQSLSVMWGSASLAMKKKKDFYHCGEENRLYR